jgi:hypothetical protein
MRGCIDTDDTNYLSFQAGPNATQWKYPGAPYMNRWITVRTRVTGSQADFYVDGVPLQTWPYTAAPGPFHLALSVGSVPWKSGDNETSFRSVTMASP